MVQCRLRELMAMKSRQTHRRVTYDVIKEATGISTSALVRLANDRFDRVDVSVLDRLCRFFNCQMGDLIVYVPDAD